MLNVSSKSNQFERDAKRNRSYKSKHDDLLLLKRPTILSKSRADIDSRPAAKTAAHVAKDENVKPVSKSESYTGFNKSLAKLDSELSRLVLKPANQQQAPKPLTIQQPVTASQDPVWLFNASIKQRLAIPSMSSSCKLLDENLQLADTLDHFLSDANENYTVIGVLGKTGVGKSTVMSLLSGCDQKCVFKPSGSESETAKHKTSGIDCYVTTERAILLDVQPLLSASILDKSISQSEQSKKVLDLKYHENSVHMQSIELACFCLSVCNVVILMEDWFFDPNLITLMHTAEMLLPNMSEYDQAFQHRTHLVYCLNKCDSLSPVDLKMMKSVYENFMKDSKLLVKGSLHSDISSVSSACFLKSKRCPKDASDANFVVLPSMRTAEPSGETGGFNGLASMKRSIRALSKELLSIKANSGQNSHVFTEKKWFVYAGKVWDTIKKSSFISEYSRLMT